MSESTIWKQRVQAWKASGQSALAFSRGRGFAASDLRRWGDVLSQTAEPAAASVRMARVVVTAAPSAPDRRGIEPRHGAPAAPLLLELGGARVTIPHGFDVGSLRALVAILDARGGRS